jgi:hypothetical protein
MSDQDDPEDQDDGLDGDDIVDDSPTTNIDKEEIMFAIALSSRLGYICKAIIEPLDPYIDRAIHTTLLRRSENPNNPQVKLMLEFYAIMKELILKHREIETVADKLSQGEPGVLPVVIN